MRQGQISTAEHRGRPDSIGAGEQLQNTTKNTTTLGLANNPSFKMASNVSIARCLRDSSSISRLASSLRALYLSSSASRPTIATPFSVRPQTDVPQARAFSPGMTPKRALSVMTRPVATPSAVVALQQQIRGMKVHSSIKKRCEHCKVCLHAAAPPWA